MYHIISLRSVLWWGRFGRKDVGKSVRVYGEGEFQSFVGTILDFNPLTGHHLIHYEDGDKLWEMLIEAELIEPNNQSGERNKGNPDTITPPSAKRQRGPNGMDVFFIATLISLS